jgi:hypothetical protein
MPRSFPAFRPALVPLLLLGCAIALRAWNIAGAPLWLDESWSRWLAEKDWAGLIHDTARYDVHPPFYYSLLKLWLIVASHGPGGMRFLSVIAGVAMLPVAWACATRIGFGRGATALAAALTLLSPPLVIAARQARPYALFAFAFALALAAALAIVQRPKKDEPRWLDWAAYAVALDLVLWLHNLGLLFAASLSGALMIALWLQARIRSAWLPFLGAHVVAGLLYLPAFLNILEQRRVWTSTWLRFHWFDVPQGLADGLAVPGPFFLLIFVLAGAGAAAMLRDRHERPTGIVIVAAAFLPAAATVAISAVSAPIFLARTLVPSVLPLLLLVVAGLWRISDLRLRAMAAGLCLALMAAASSIAIMRPPEEKWDRLSAFLDAHVAGGEEVWLLPNELAMPLHFASPASRPSYRIRGIPADFPAPFHRGPRYSGTMAVPGATAADAVWLMADARGRGLKGIWLVSRFPALFDPGTALPAALGRDHLRQHNAMFAPLLVDHYVLVPDTKRVQPR